MHQNSWLLGLASLLFVGCVGSAEVRGSASVTAPDLVYVSPGVQVIADYREPIFYSDRYYWRYDGHVWFRSTSYTSGWVRYQAPVAILRIERPSMYIHYRGSARASTEPQPTPTPAMTHEQRKDEHEAQKEERKEQKAEQKEERKEQKAEQKEERKEQKEERKDQKNDQKDAKKDHHK